MANVTCQRGSNTCQRVEEELGEVGPPNQLASGVASLMVSKSTSFSFASVSECVTVRHDSRHGRCLETMGLKSVQSGSPQCLVCR